jgi:hypothetical protein
MVQNLININIKLVCFIIKLNSLHNELIYHISCMISLICRFLIVWI